MIKWFEFFNKIKYKLCVKRQINNYHKIKLKKKFLTHIDYFDCQKLLQLIKIYRYKYDYFIYHLKRFPCRNDRCHLLCPRNVSCNVKLITVTLRYVRDWKKEKDKKLYDSII